MRPGLQVLMADRKLGAASKLAFLQLWEMAGEEPAEIVIGADWLGGRCGRSPSAALKWLRELEKHDLIKIVERNERRGTIRLAVYNPCPGGREANPDPQARLPFGPAEHDAPPPDAEVAPSRPPPPPVAEVSAPKPPRPLVPKKQEITSYQSTKDFKESKAPKSPKDSKSAPDGAGPMAAVVDAITATVLVHSEPAAQKALLKARIQSVCRGDVADWVAGAAANTVIYDRVPDQELDAILRDVDAMRAAGSLKSAGAFFHSQARKLAARHGATWPRQQRAEVSVPRPPRE